MQFISIEWPLEKKSKTNLFHGSMCLVVDESVLYNRFYKINIIYGNLFNYRAKYICLKSHVTRLHSHTNKYDSQFV